MAFPRTFCPCVGKRVRRWDADEKGFISAPCPVCDPPQGWLGCDLRGFTSPLNPRPNPRPAVEKNALDRQRGMTAWAKALWARPAAGNEADDCHASFVSQQDGGRP